MAGTTRAFLTFNPELNHVSSLEAKADAEENEIEQDADTMAEMPLQHEWKIWEQIELSQGSHGDNYTDNMKPISSFSTVKVRYFSPSAIKWFKKVV